MVINDARAAHVPQDVEESCTRTENMLCLNYERRVHVQNAGNVENVLSYAMIV